MTDYRNRLLLPEKSDGKPILFYTHTGLLIARGYERVVIGERGPYIEFLGWQIQHNSVAIPFQARWRKNSDECFYVEYRSKDNAYVKLYRQTKQVDYADYKVGYWYVSPFDLCSDQHQELILRLEQKQMSLPGL